MASGAFPGAFHNVTLVDFSRPDRYQHLFDGGPSDNLGVHTLLRVIDAVCAAQASRKKRLEVTR